MTVTTQGPLPDPATIADLRLRILGWYATEQRNFPWRRVRDPWSVLVSEVMLQQTQAHRVAERFGPFMRRFPTTAAMAAASDADVLAAWSGLGHNRRAVALRRAAITVERHGWPDDVPGLEGLPGIGPYTARAVAALAFGRSVGAVDTNVRRWLVRRLGMARDASPPRLQAVADALAAGALDTDQAAAWMHASMEFGATVCRARNPDCEACPVADGCPSRGKEVAVPVARQPTFAGSAREARGALLKALASAPEHRLLMAEVAAIVSDADLDLLLPGLERTGSPTVPMTSSAWAGVGATTAQWLQSAHEPNRLANRPSGLDR